MRQRHSTGRQYRSLGRLHMDSLPSAGKGNGARPFFWNVAPSFLSVLEGAFELLAEAGVMLNVVALALSHPSVSPNHHCPAAALAAAESPRRKRKGDQRPGGPDVDPRWLIAKAQRKGERRGKPSIPSFVVGMTRQRRGRLHIIRS